MSFKYINPGYAELLSTSGGTTVTGEQYSKTGVSFWQPNDEKGISLSESPTECHPPSFTRNSICISKE